MVVNPYNRREKKIQLTPEHVHTIVFWSKNYGAFIKGRYGDQLTEKGFNLFFHFTINSSSVYLEPQVPPTKERFKQLNVLCKKHGPDSVTWRFDPICLYEINGKRKNNLNDFQEIAENVAKAGVTRCITSFRDDYRKVKRRAQSLDGFRFNDVTADQKVHILMRMNVVLKSLGIHLSVCCEKDILNTLPPDDPVHPAACIDHHLLDSLFGSRLNGKNDAGQRKKMGCGCHLSVDVGDYRHHPCHHNCLYCYANPAGVATHNQMNGQGASAG